MDAIDPQLLHALYKEQIVPIEAASARIISRDNAEGSVVSQLAAQPINIRAFAFNRMALPPAARIGHPFKIVVRRPSRRRYGGEPAVAAL